MRIAIAGSSGLIGQALVDNLSQDGHVPVRLVRGDTRRTKASIPWDPAEGRIESDALEDIDAVVCLSGENIAGRWSKRKKDAILQSRVDTASLLANTIASMSKPPSVFICASAIGYYGDRGAEQVDETSPRGEGFLADVCEAWEEATQPAVSAGARTVILRLGVVLDPANGLLKQIAPIFKAGLGGTIGSGRQYMSWIALADVVQIVRFIVESKTLSGPINCTAPNPVTNKAFTKALGRVLNRPTILPVPAPAIKLALGEAGNELALASTRAIPSRLISGGYSFLFPDIQPALEAMFDRG